MAEERTYSWLRPENDPPVDAASGFDVMKARVGGRVGAPIMDTLEIDMLSVEEGRVVIGIRPGPFLANHVGVVHGGVAATLIDTAASAAVYTALSAAAVFSTLSMTTTYVRPIVPDAGLVTCTAEVLSVGRTTASARATIEDERPRMLGHGTVSLVVSRPE